MLDQALAKLRASQEWERLVAALLARAELSGKDQATLDLREAGRVLDRELGAAARASSALVKALRLAPSDPSLLAETMAMARRGARFRGWSKSCACSKLRPSFRPRQPPCALR